MLSKVFFIFLSNIKYYKSIISTLPQEKKKSNTYYRILINLKSSYFLIVFIVLYITQK